MTLGTLEDIEKEYETAKKELEPIEAEREKAVSKCNQLYEEMKQYKIQNGLYMPMSELEKHKGENINYIELVVRGENGELSTETFYCDDMFSVDKDGHLDFSSNYSGVMDYDKNSGKYIFSYYCHDTFYDFIGILDVSFAQ